MHESHTERIGWSLGFGASLNGTLQKGQLLIPHSLFGHGQDLTERPRREGARNPAEHFFKGRGPPDDFGDSIFGHADEPR
jgi:hypothetical protein